MNMYKCCDLIIVAQRHSHSVFLWFTKVTNSLAFTHECFRLLCMLCIFYKDREMSMDAQSRTPAGNKKNRANLTTATQSTDDSA